MTTRGGAPRARRALVAALISLPQVCACDVVSTVGYNEREQALGIGPTLACPSDAALYACAGGACVVRDLFPAEHGIVAMAVDDENIFFVSAPNVLSKLPIAGERLVDLFGGLVNMMKFTIDEHNVYWSENGPRIRSVPKDGGAIVDVTSLLGIGNATDIAVDTDYVYAVMPAYGRIVMVAKPSGPPTILSGQGAPQAITVDETHVYWVNQGAGSPRSGQLVRALRGDLTSAQVILSNLDAPVTLTLTHDEVFWASPNAIMKVAKSGGSPQSIAGGFSEPMAVAVFDGNIYLAGSGGLMKTPVTGDAPMVLEIRPMSSMALGCSGVYATSWFDNVLIRYGK